MHLCEDLRIRHGQVLQGYALASSPSATVHVRPARADAWAGLLAPLQPAHRLRDRVLRERERGNLSSPQQRSDDQRNRNREECKRMPVDTIMPREGALSRLVIPS